MKFKKNLKLKILFLLLLFIFSNIGINSFSAEKQSSKEKLIKAEELFRKGKYQQSLDIYKDIVKKFPNFKVFYNIGNIYFKLDKYAMAKLYYLKAYKIKQNDEDLNHNIEAVNLRLENNIALPEVDPFSKLLTGIKNSFSLNTYLMFSLIIFIIGSLVFTFYEGKGKLYIIIAILSILLIFIIIDIVKIDDYYSKAYILTVKKCDVKSEPTDLGNTVFIINSGVVFNIKQKVDKWYLVELKNGYRGWISADKGKDFRLI